MIGTDWTLDPLDAQPTAPARRTIPHKASRPRTTPVYRREFLPVCLCTKFEMSKRVRQGSPETKIADEAVVAIDNQRRVVYWGRGAARLYRLSAEEALGRSLADCYQYRWDSVEDEHDAMAALASRGIASGENTHVLRSGEQVRVRWGVTVLRDANGRESGLLAVVRPVEADPPAPSGQE